MVHSLLCPFLVIYLCSQLGHKAGKFCFLCNSPQRWGLCVSSGRFPLVCSRNFLERVLAIFSVVGTCLMRPASSSICFCVFGSLSVSGGAAYCPVISGLRVVGSFAPSFTVTSAYVQRICLSPSLKLLVLPEIYFSD
jgi:hypothetical protein